MWRRGVIGERAEWMAGRKKRWNVWKNPASFTLRGAKGTAITQTAVIIAFTNVWIRSQYRKTKCSYRRRLCCWSHTARAKTTTKKMPLLVWQQRSTIECSSFCLWKWHYNRQLDKNGKLTKQRWYSISLLTGSSVLASEARHHFQSHFFVHFSRRIRVGVRHKDGNDWNEHLNSFGDVRWIEFHLILRFGLGDCAPVLVGARASKSL